MVVAGRRNGVGRRRRPPRLAPRLALLAGLAVLLFIAGTSIKRSSAAGPDEALIFADRVRPAVGDSTRQGASLEALRSQAGTLGLHGTRREVDRLAGESRASADEAATALAAPALRGAHGLLMASLTARAQALGSLRTALGSGFEAGPPEPSVDTVVTMGVDLSVSDRAYRLFLDALPPAARATLPGSVWITDPARYARPEATAMVNTLRASGSAGPVHDVSIITVGLDPASVGTIAANTRVLPLTKTLRLQVVVANAGNVAAKRLPVEAVVTSTGGVDSARQFVDLTPGQRITVELTLRPSPVGALDLKVTVGPLPGEASLADNQRLSSYVMR